MSAAAADSAASAAPGKPRKKKLVVIVAGALVVLAAAAGGAFYMKKKGAAHDEEGAAVQQEAPVAHSSSKNDPAHPPSFLPLEPFVVNLADKEADRYAQIGIVLEVDNPLFAEQMKTYMPAIRNGILMILAHKNSTELLERAGKEQLAREVMRETVGVMGIDLPEPEPPKKRRRSAEDEEEGSDEAPRKPARRAPREHNPVRHVHFSSFIIQ